MPILRVASALNESASSRASMDQLASALAGHRAGKLLGSFWGSEVSKM